MRARVLDSINTELNIQVDDGRTAYKALQNDLSSMFENWGERLELQENINKELTVANRDLKVEVKKERRKRKGWTVGTVVAFIGGVYLGIQAAKD
jgi:hypothetical protein